MLVISTAAKCCRGKCEILLNKCQEEEYEKQISKLPEGTFEATFERIEEKREKLNELKQEKVEEAFKTMFGK